MLHLTTFLADMLQDELQANLNYLIDEQSSDGTWDPVRSGSDLYAEEWDKVIIGWRGRLTLEALAMLRKFGRMASNWRKK